MLEERAPARLVLLGALADAENLPITFAVHADRDQQRDIADFPRPAALERKRCFYATYPLVRRECTIVILLGSGLRIVCTLWSTLVTTRRSFNAAGK